MKIIMFLFVTFLIALMVENAHLQDHALNRGARSDTGGQLSKQILYLYEKLFTLMQKETNMAKGILFETMCTEKGCEHNSGCNVCAQKSKKKSPCLPDPVKYLGCYKDDSRRIFNSRNTGSISTQGPFECQRFCAGYKYFGLQAGSWCFCGNKMRNYPKKSGCTYKCANNKHFMCGGSWRMAVYKNL